MKTEKFSLHISNNTIITNNTPTVENTNRDPSNISDTFLRKIVTDLCNQSAQKSNKRREAARECIDNVIEIFKIFQKIDRILQTKNSQFDSIPENVKNTVVENIKSATKSTNKPLDFRKCKEIYFKVRAAIQNSTNKLDRTNKLNPYPDTRNKQSPIVTFPPMALNQEMLSKNTVFIRSNDSGRYANQVEPIILPTIKDLNLIPNLKEVSNNIQNITSDDFISNAENHSKIIMKITNKISINFLLNNKSELEESHQNFNNIFNSEKKN